MAETMTQAVARRRREREAIETEERALLARQRGVRPLPAYRQNPGGGLAGALWEGVLQGDTALRSAASTFTLDGANSLAAGLEALVPVKGQGLRERYAANLEAERARDRYDALHRPMAQQVGAAAATGISLLGGKALPRTKLIAGAAPRSALDTAAILGTGGVSGLAFQSLTDAAARRPTDWRDGLGAIGGGVAGAAALPLGPGKAAAIGAAATMAAQDALHGRPVSLNELGRSAAAGRAVGGVASATGRNWSQNLRPQAKGKLGEALGAIRSDINRMQRDSGPKQLIKPVANKPGTIPDGRSVIRDDRSVAKFFEDKFGLSARLSAGQKIAQEKFGADYIVYHFVPEHVGKLTSLPFTGLAPQLVDRRAGNRPQARRKP